MIAPPTLSRRLVTTDLPVLGVVLLALGPFAWMLLTSITSGQHLAALGVAIAPADWVIDNYTRLIAHTSFLGNMGHTLFVPLGTMAFGLLVSVTSPFPSSLSTFI